jgi:hypothetical protein
MRRHLEGAIPRLGEVVEGLPDDGLDGLLARCLAKSAAERYQSASELQGALARLYEDWYRARPPGAPGALAQSCTAI